ncbi:MAG: hypothetical protein U0625_10915 [Phycisphaerales bacterium]
MAATPEPPLARSVGAFVGHIVDAIVREPEDASGAAAVQTRRTTQEYRSSEGVLLRRTVIDEVIVPASGTTPPSA